MAKTKQKATRTPKTALVRPPVVVVMGHVDHGKTTLLEAIRAYGTSQDQVSLTAKEQGGITQKIGAYQVTHNGQPITFLDTPGHEAFGQMRSRGAQVADLAILVVAANDGVKPQTKEAITHIKAAGIPYVVAINKIDLPEISIDKVKGQLAEAEVFVEGYGGDIVNVPISAKEKKGIDQLMEMVLLVSQMQELKADPEHPLQAYVIETFMDSHRGVVVNVVVKDGRIQVGDWLSARVEKQPSPPAVSGKVKALLDENGQRLHEVTPGQPAQILGFKIMPLVGAKVGKVAEVEKVEKVSEGGVKTELAKGAEGEKGAQVAEVEKVEKERAAETEEAKMPAQEQKKIYLVLKADTQGSLEAIKANLTEEVELVGEGVGEISESDILLARSTGAQVFGFQVRFPAATKKLAEMEKVKVTVYTVIYHLLEEIQKQVLTLIEPTIDEKVFGQAEVIAEFTIKGSHIAGCKVKDGLIHKSHRVRLKRGDEIIGEAQITAMQKERAAVVQVKKGDEVGLVFKPDLPFTLGDTVTAFLINK
jgi:translation initiation factor IF-2